MAYYATVACGVAFLPGAAGGIYPEIRHSIPSTATPRSKLITLQLETAFVSSSAEIVTRTWASVMPVSFAISLSSFWPCFLRYWMTVAVYIFGLFIRQLVTLISITSALLQAHGQVYESRSSVLKNVTNWFLVTTAPYTSRKTGFISWNQYFVTYYLRCFFRHLKQDLLKK